MAGLILLKVVWSRVGAAIHAQVPNIRDRDRWPAELPSQVRMINRSNSTVTLLCAGRPARFRLTVPAPNWPRNLVGPRASLFRASFPLSADDHSEPDGFGKIIGIYLCTAGGGSASTAAAIPKSRTACAAGTAGADSRYRERTLPVTPDLPSRTVMVTVPAFTPEMVAWLPVEVRTATAGLLLVHFQLASGTTTGFPDASLPSAVKCQSGGSLPRLRSRERFRCVTR